MKDKIRLEFDSYEIKTIINALNDLRNKSKEQNISTDIVDEILLKLIDEIDKKKQFIKILTRDNYGKRY